MGTVGAARIVERTDLTPLPGPDAVIRGWLGRLPGLLAWFLLTLSLLRGALQVLAFTDPGTPVDPDLASAVLSTGSWGNSWILQTAAAFILLALSWLLRRSTRALGWVVAGLTMLLLVAQSGMGHGVEERWAPLWLGRVIDITHLLGAGLWLGTLAVLAVAVIPSLAQADAQSTLAEVVRRFSRFAQVGAALLVLTGVVATWTYTNTLSDLWTSDWGRLLLGKLALLVGIAGLGFYNWRVVTPRLLAGAPPATRNLRRAVAAELLLGLLLLAITAILVATALPGDG